MATTTVVWLAEYVEMLQLDDGQKDAPSKVTIVLFID